MGRKGLRICGPQGMRDPKQTLEWWEFGQLCLVRGWRVVQLDGRSWWEARDICLALSVV